ncbi:DNA-binding SARP family transcriptional activator [Streptomyces sp. Amel2xB2]|uniref:AfsR/SARP family transcriptional regulator n=1 Tax=Streptomyces sp. Amel2xB2 TaxID=1305829 RepID=UPI000DBFA2CD|nr:BTAD domain-containing putative transcriptional regulator [Streptomyces sp. Amel2xB2]RAJ62433.1 DNA-binding SARP family transcriptional activator [Streptomyces sp. Amel2xB2]
MVDLIALGPLELWHKGARVPLGPVQCRRVLAVLLHARGEPVSVETLVARVWDESKAPPSSLESLRSSISKLRKNLGPVGDDVQLDCPSPRQYRLRVPAESVDLLRFERLRTRAREAVGHGSLDAAVALLRKAEALWRGEPLAEFTGEWAASVRDRLLENLRRVKEERIGLELELGHHADLVGELRELVAENPFAQGAVGSLMLALYRSGRHAESLDVYRTTYRLLDDRLGIPPGAQLQQLNRQILDQDPALDLTPAPAAAEGGDAGGERSAGAVTGSASGHGTRGGPGSGSGSGPGGGGGGGGGGEGTGTASAAGRDESAGSDAGGAASRLSGTLPRDLRDFTGRTGELAALLAGPAHPDGDDETAMPVTALYGMPGIGKTATAVRAAHRMKDRYPDGAYYVDLRGYSDQSRCEPREALALLLRTSGAAAEIPESLDERAARWREWTARHRALVVLDNAATTAQVTPLLPGAPACRAIVTSRVRLAGLDGAQPVFLDALSANEAMELFGRVAGAARTGDRATLRQVVDACGRHPLALQLLAGRFRHRESWDLEHLHDRLTQAPHPLEELDAGIDVGLTKAFQLSYTELGDSTRRLLRRLALHTGPAVTLGAASTLLGTDMATARREVEALLDAFLLSEAQRGSYQLHDLVGAFALQVCQRDEPESARRSATERLLTYYLRSADRADRLVHPRRRRLPVDGDETDEVRVHAEEFADADEASVWLEVERANLLAAARTARDSVPSRIAGLSHVLAPTLRSWGVWRLAGELHAAAVSELRSGTDRRALAQALTERADIRAQECPSDALHDAAEALSLFEKLDDTEGSAAALLQLGRGRLAAGRGDSALRTLDRALRLHEQCGDRYSQAEVLNVQGVALHYRGDHRAAAERFRAMLRLAEELGDQQLESRALNNMGDLSLLRERYEEARNYFERSLDLARRFGARRVCVILEGNLAVVHNATGEPERALASLQRALDGYRSGGDTSGESDTLIALGKTLADLGREREALLHFTRAEELARSIDNAYEQQRALVHTADIHRTSGRVKEALDIYKKGLRISRGINYPLGSARALDGLARASVFTNTGGRVRTWAEEALALYTRLGAKAEAAALRSFLGDRKATGS